MKCATLGAPTFERQFFRVRANKEFRDHCSDTRRAYANK